MIHYRPFRNCDPPAIAKIWRAQPGSSPLMQPVTAGLFDELVFSKPYFAREGLILAVDDNAEPVGFVHAGFGPNDERSGLDLERGTTSLLLVAPHPDRETIARELLSESEQYLGQSGAKTICGGGTELLAPFYLGLYGGARLPGVLASDSLEIDVFRVAGYEELPCREIMRRRLDGFRPPIDRHLVQIRRKFQLHQTADPVPTTWWDACTYSQIDRIRFELTRTSGGEPIATADFWDIEPLASHWGAHAMGLLSLEMRTADSDLATFFLGESLRQLQAFGTMLVEVQIAPGDTQLTNICLHLGFEHHDRGVLFRKRD